jgi:hypothetical protein
MRIWITVASELEGAEIRRGLENATVRAFVRIMSAQAVNLEPPGALCGPRCFLEFVDALLAAETARATIEDPAERPRA